MKNIPAVIAACALFCGVAAAQTQTSDVQQDKAAIQNTKTDITKDRTDVRKNEEKLTDLNKAHADAMQDLNAKEKAAVDAVRDDKSLTAAQKKARVQDIRKDYNSRRKDINTKYSADKRALRTDIRKDRRDIHQDRRQLHQERTDVRHDMHSNGGKH